MGFKETLKNTQNINDNGVTLLKCITLSVGNLHSTKSEQQKHLLHMYRHLLQPSKNQSNQYKVERTLFHEHVKMVSFAKITFNERYVCQFLLLMLFFVIFDC